MDIVAKFCTMLFIWNKILYSKKVAFPVFAGGKKSNRQNVKGPSNCMSSHFSKVTFSSTSCPYATLAVGIHHCDTSVTVLCKHVECRSIARLQASECSSTQEHNMNHASCRRTGCRFAFSLLYAWFMFHHKRHFSYLSTCMVFRTGGGS